MNDRDSRYGASPFPYGPFYDFGVSLERVVGAPSDPLGLTEGTVYVAITLHPAYEQYASDTDAQASTIYVAASLLADVGPGNAVVRVGRTAAFDADTGGPVTSGTTTTAALTAVVGQRGVVGVFASGAPTVFDAVLTAGDIDGTEWGGESGYSLALNCTAVYYWLWDRTDLRPDGPVRRVIPLPDSTFGGNVPSAGNKFGVFVPTVDGAPQSPLPAIWFGENELVSMCAGGIAQVGETFSVEGDDDANVGEIELTREPQWIDVGGANMGGESGWSGGIWRPLASTFQDLNFSATFSWASAEAAAPLASVSHAAGYFFPGWYNPSVGLTAEGQNENGFAVTGADLGKVRLLSGHFGFAGGTDIAPNEIHLCLEPPTGANPSWAVVPEFSIRTSALTGAGTHSEVVARAYVGEGSIVLCTGTFWARMWIAFAQSNVFGYKALTDGIGEPDEDVVLLWDNGATAWMPAVFRDILSDRYVDMGGAEGNILVYRISGGVGKWRAELPNVLVDGTADGQVLTWRVEGETGGWVAEMPTAGLPTGTAAGQLLVWDGSEEEWVPGLVGTETGQVLVWDGSAWGATAGVTALDGNLLVLNEAGEVTFEVESCVEDDILLFDGSYWTKATLTTIDVVTAVQYSTSNNRHEFKSATVKGLVISGPTEWQAMPGGNTVAGAGAVNTGSTVNHTHN